MMRIRIYDKVSGFLLALLYSCVTCGQARAQVSYSPQPIAFGAVKLGQSSAVLSSTLTNTGADTLKFVGGSSMTGSSAFHYVTDNCLMRPPGGSCILQYRFTPTQVGPVTGANVVQTNHGPFPLNFTGTGVDTVTPSPRPPASVVAGVHGSPVAITLAVGQETPIEAVPADSLGKPLGVPVVWTSSNPAVATTRLPYATVTQAAVLVARGAGLATLTAASGGASTTMAVTVTQPDTTPVSFTMTGLQVLNVPSKWVFTFPALPLWTGRYLINLVGTAGDTVARASCGVAKP